MPARTRASTPPDGPPRPGHGGRAVSSAGAGLVPLGEPFPSLPSRIGGSEPSQQDGARTGKKKKQGGIDWKGARCSVLMAGEGQPPTSTIAGNHDPLCMQGLVQSVQLPRRRGKVEAPTSNQPPRGAQGHRLLGPAALRSCPFASLHGEARARLGPGGFYRRSRNGGPQTCLPAACGVAQVVAQCSPSSSTQTQDPCEGPSLAGRTTESSLKGSLIRQAREEAERSRQGCLARSP